MTIKEIEELTGLPRTNIRYYEREGLIQPKRSENRYRDYSEEDAHILLRVRLLRLEEKGRELDRSRMLTQTLIEKGESFSTLNAAEYLNAEDNPWEAGAKKLSLPWRRFWAWETDALVFSLLADLALEPLVMEGWFNSLLNLVVMFLGTSLSLHLFATTPGKAVFGIQVLNLEGEKLSMWDALERNWICLWEGQGLRLPIISYYFMYKGYMEADVNPLPWELDSELTIRDDMLWRYVLMALIHIVVFAWIVLSVLMEGGYL